MSKLLNVNSGDTVSITLKINKAIPTTAIFLVTAADVNYAMAKKLDPSIEATHVANLPNLDDDVSRDPKALDYIVLQSIDSLEDLVLANDWIHSIVVTDSSDYQVDFSNVKPEEMEVVKLVLNNLNLNGRYTITKK